MQLVKRTTSGVNVLAMGALFCAFGAQAADDHADSINLVNQNSNTDKVFLNHMQKGVIGVGSDADFFYFDVPNNGANENYNMQIYTQGTLDTIGTLYTSSGAQLLTNDDYNNGQNFPTNYLQTNFYMTHTLSPGRYFIKVHPWNSRTGSYRLFVEGETATSYFGPTYSDTRANGVLEGQLGCRLMDPTNGYSLTETQYLDFAADTEWNCIWLTADATLTTWSSSDSSGEMDTYVHIRDSDGNSILYDDDSGPGVQFTATKRLTSGIYYVNTMSYYTDIRSKGSYNWHLSLKP